MQVIGLDFEGALNGRWHKKKTKKQKTKNKKNNGVGKSKSGACKS